MTYHNTPIRIDKKEEENNTPALIQSTVCEDTKQLEPLWVAGWDAE